MRVVRCLRSCAYVKVSQLAVLFVPTVARRYPVFRGRPSGNESQHRLDFQLMTKIQDTLFISSMSKYCGVGCFFLQKLTWRSGQSDRNMCAVRGKHRDECHNFIKVLVPRNDDLVFICGTNGFNPMCRYYRVSIHCYEINGLARCPFDSKQTNVALFAEGKLYSATVADFQASDSVIYRSMGDGSALRTIKYDSKWLKEPHFLHAAEYGNYVYFFYREIVVYSRVARICKNDVGGSQRVLEKHWTSFVKARLNCSVPGESFFYFDVLQSITDIIDINGVPSVVGVFTTQMNSIPGSAVCAFSMADIEKVFMGRFKEQKTADSVWTPFPDEKLPKPRPGCCAGHGPAASLKSSVEFPDETLQFIKSHPLMDTAVPSIRDEPWFTKTRVRYRMTALAVDNEAGPFKNYTVVFIGSESGILLKVLSKTSSSSLNDSVLLEEIDVFNKAKCLSGHEDDRRVLSLHLDKEAHSLYVAFSSCVIRMPLSRCERHSACIALRDPYCGWKASGACERISPGVMSGYEQDVELGNTAHLGDCQAFLGTTSAPDYKSFGDPTSGIWDIQAGDTNQMVHMNILITCVFAAFLMGALMAGLFVFCYRDSFLRKPRQIHKDAECAPSSSDSTGSFVKLNGLFDSPVKEYQANMDCPKLYTNLLSKDLNAPGADTKTMILRDGCQPPELAALPTPESTPVLQQKGLTPIKNQWERAHGKVSRKESNSAPKSPQFLSSSPAHAQLALGHTHIPSAVVLPNATHELPSMDSIEDDTLPRSSEKRSKNPDSKRSHKDPKRSVDARNTLNDLLKHLNDSVANPNAIIQEEGGPRPRQHLTLEPMEELTEIPPRCPVERHPYTPLLLPAPAQSHKESGYARPSLPHQPLRQPEYGGHTGAPKVPAPPERLSQGCSVHLPKWGNHGGVRHPPTQYKQRVHTPHPPSRLDSHLGPGGHPPSVSRQSSYSGHGSLPRTGLKRTPSLKPDVPPNPMGSPHRLLRCGW
uniref:Sema domain, transmembrane domain (TM), and cytoplasmic domain, (semaphorin) 6D, like n=1 Tax=Neogobius melanostomus TaxID=47308 RepID=A0A8C6TKU2_9GOBI